MASVRDATSVKNCDPPVGSPFLPSVFGRAASISAWLRPSITIPASGTVTLPRNLREESAPQCRVTTQPASRSSAVVRQQPYHTYRFVISTTLAVGAASSAAAAAAAGGVDLCCPKHHAEACPPSKRSGGRMGWTAPDDPA